MTGYTHAPVYPPRENASVVHLALSRSQLQQESAFFPSKIMTIEAVNMNKDYRSVSVHFNEQLSATPTENKLQLQYYNNRSLNTELP